MDTKSFNAFMTSKLAMIIAGVILVSSLLMNALLIAATCIALILLSFGTIMWSKASSKNLLTEMHVSRSYIFPHETTQLDITIKNNKILPIWTNIQVFNEGDSLLADEDFGLISFSHYSFKTQLTYKKRGIYSIGSIHISTGDLFGFHKNSQSHKIEEKILVFPKIIPIDYLDMDSLDFFGNYKGNHFITDPAMTAGIKTYDYNSSFKNIDWIATSKTQELKEKIYDPMSHYDLCLFVDVSGYKDNDESDFEQMISVVATFINELNDKNYNYRLMTNGQINYADMSLSFEDQYLDDLSVLARLTYNIDSHVLNLHWLEANSYTYYFCSDTKSAKFINDISSYSHKVLTSEKEASGQNILSIKDILTN